MGYRKILIKNGHIFDGDRFFDADILIEKGRIAGIGRYEDSAAHDSDYVIDADGKLVTPGLVDVHTHIYGVSIDEFGTSAEGSSFPFGVTFVADASARQGSKATLASHRIGTVVFADTSVKDDNACFENTDSMLDAYGDAVVGVKIFFDTTGGQVRSIRPLEQVCAYARAHGIKVMVHSSNSPVSMLDIVKTLSKGDILSHTYHGGVNTCADDGYAAIKLAKEKGVVVDTGLAGYIHTDFAVLKAAIDSKMIPDTVSTDITNLSAFVRGGRYGMTLAMSVMRAVGMEEEALLRAVSVNAAAALGVSERAGRIKVGERADIAVLDYGEYPFDFNINENNTLKADLGYRCTLCVCGGQVVYRG